MPDATSFGPYQLQGLLGRGGMGEVHRAFDTSQNRTVALKLLPESLSADDGFVERFKRESYAAARLQDPHVIPIHRYGEIDGRLYIDMRLVEGADLGALLARDGPLTADVAVSIVAQAAEALDAAHAENLVHRDVKPSNLLVTPRHFVYLVDFGIAHTIGLYTQGKALTATGATVGTLDYMAPERFLGHSIDARADVYALACVLYECLTGRRPFPVEGLPALMYAHLNTPPPRVAGMRTDVPAALDEVIARGMAKDPQLRYPTAGALAADAARAVGGRMPGRVPERAPTTRTAIPRPPTPDAPPTYIPPRVREQAPPARAPRSSTGWVVAVVSLVGSAVLVGVLLGRGAAGNAESGSTPSSTTTTTVTAQPSPTTRTAQAPVGDLSLTTPISTPACDSSYVTFVGSAVNPGRYPAEVAGFLAAHPGSSYLLTEDSCSSLRARLPDGRIIYAVYLGPFDTFAEACAARAQAGGDAYVKVLDNVSPDNQLLTC